MLENMLDYLRILLYTALIVLAFFLYQAWQQDHSKLPEILPETLTKLTPERFVPERSSQEASVPASANAVVPSLLNNPASGKPLVQTATISVNTDVFALKIDPNGGDIVEVRLRQYPESLNSKVPFMLLNDLPETRYIAESGLLSNDGPDTQTEQAIYHTAEPAYQLAQNANTLTVDLVWQNSLGLKVTKRFSFTRGSYEIKVSYRVDNQTSKPWEGNLYTQLLRTNHPPPSSSGSGLSNLTTYFGAALSSPDKPFQKITFKQMQEKNLNAAVVDGWAAMVQHYFVGAWIPGTKVISNYYTRVTGNGLYTIGMMGPKLIADPGTTVTTDAKLYAGPAIADKLQAAAPGLQLTIDYGWFWFISTVIFWMMQKIYNVVQNWGWSIIIVTIIIKLLFYHLSAKSYRSMSGLKRLQPRIEMLKERFGSDKQKLTQATLELYRQEKVNPMSGCLPILIQIPVFIALYWVLVESVQLRQAPFIFWIHDLSQKDPYYVLPLLMGISMFLQQRLNPPPPDPMQARIMMFMPVIFTLLFINFPSGLMLYWFVNNTLSFLQQWYIMHHISKEEKVTLIKAKK